MRMFGSRDAAFFIESLLKMNANEVLLVGNVPGWHNALMSSRPSISDTPYDAMANNQLLWVLDFIPSPMYRVVPQKIWAPPSSDWHRFVEQAHLRMPIFFIKNNDAIGLPLPRATVGDTAGLRNADLPAPLGGGHSTQIRICVSSPFSLSPSPPPSPPPAFPPPSVSVSGLNVVVSQWPGYEIWERQIQIRDQTRHRNEITLERFAKLVAGVVDRFLTVRLFVLTGPLAFRACQDLN
jgi:hypothetical protein